MRRKTIVISIAGFCAMGIARALYADVWEGSYENLTACQNLRIVVIGSLCLNFFLVFRVFTLTRELQEKASRKCVNQDRGKNVLELINTLRHELEAEKHKSSQLEDELRREIAEWKIKYERASKDAQ